MIVLFRKRMNSKDMMKENTMRTMESADMVSINFLNSLINP